MNNSNNYTPMVWKGMDLNYVSKEVANRFFGNIINMSREDLLKQIIESPVFELLSKDEADKQKYEYAIEFLEIKNKLEQAR